MATSTGHPILQFGTSRFLQAHVDLFVSEAAERGDALGGITVVQTTGSAVSSARTAALARDEGYEVIVRGLVDGLPLEVRKTSRSIRESLDARTQWAEVRARVCGPVRVIVSNTGDTGWQLDPGDTATLLRDGAAVPVSFPAKLVVLLHDRWRTRPDADLTVLPCELVPRNGDRLRDIAVDLARNWACAPACVAWMQSHVVWASSLVDRIVSEALDPVGAVAEPYALWAIERQPRLQLPCSHPAIVLTDDLARFERLKLFLLNLGHTVLADLWLRGGHDGDMTVRQAMNDTALRDGLEAAWQQDVLPVFDALGEGDAARTYLVEVRDRFLNPYLAHRLADIAHHHVQKKQRRIEPLVALARSRVPGLLQPHLRRVLAD